MSVTLHLRLGDCTQVLATMPEGSVGAVVCDPPYGLELMGEEWDTLTRNIMRSTGDADVARKERYGRSLAGRLSNLPDYGSLSKAAREAQEWHRAWLAECYRVLPPGGVLKAFSATRTFHRMSAAMQEAGFTEVGIEAWTYGSGFPKSKNLPLFIDKAAKATGDRGRAIPMASLHFPGEGRYSTGGDGEKLTSNPVAPYVPVTDEARTWSGWGTALKPAWEPVLVGRKPL
jgi:DNA modification methylase